ncbi:MAG: hypothetical protein IRZ02_04535 [Acidothermus sp.]|nr:hypothetical protein [Acidothermus sp.]
MTVTTTTRVGDLPRVNLLPPELHERRRVRAAQAGTAIAVVLALAGVIFARVQEGHSVDAAKQQVANQEQRQAQLSQQLRSLNEVRTTAAQLAASEALLTRAMATEIQWSTYLSDLSVIVPNSVWLTQLSLQESLQPGSLTAPSAASGTIGSISLQGYGKTWPDLATLLDALGKEAQRGVVQPYFSTAQESFIGDVKVLQYQASTVLSPAALSDRCANPGSC